MIYMEGQNAEGGKGAKDTDAKIKVQRGLTTFDHWLSTLIWAKWFSRVRYNYNNDLTVGLG